MDHGTIALTLETNLDEAREQLESLPALGIDLDDVTEALLEEGIEKFIEPYDATIEGILQKKEALLTT